MLPGALYLGQLNEMIIFEQVSGQKIKYCVF